MTVIGAEVLIGVIVLCGAAICALHFAVLKRQRPDDKTFCFISGAGAIGSGLILHGLTFVGSAASGFGAKLSDDASVWHGLLVLLFALCLVLCFIRAGNLIQGRESRPSRE